MAQKSSPIREAIVKYFSKGVSKDQLDTTLEKIAKEVGKEKRIVKQIFTRYLNKGMMKEEGGRYVWVGQ